jgi:hypothetical protein
MTPSFEDAAPDRFDLLYHFSQISPEHAAEFIAKARQADEEEAAQKAAKSPRGKAATVAAEGD